MVKQQLTLFVEDEIEEKLRETAHSLRTNRQGAINHILQMYFQKEFSQSSVNGLQ